MKKCYRYTWMGPVTETTNQTSNCNDFEDDDDRPCFEPLVWTFNDESGNNEPDLGELEAACSEKGCDPFCTPSPSQSCVKYSEWSGNTLTYVSKVTTTTTNISSLSRVFLFQFCGKVNLDWNRGKGDVNRCFREGSKQYCFCEQNMKYLCNEAVSPFSPSFPLALTMTISATLFWF